MKISKIWNIFRGNGLERPILEDPLDKDGYFKVPGKFTEQDEVRWAKKRIDAGRVSQYADSHCGLPNTFDSTGAYLCGGRKDGGSSPCNKRKGSECFIRVEELTNPTSQSCAYWEVSNAGDSEPRYCDPGRLEDARISFGETPNPEGFGCIRCEYGQGTLSMRDSQYRNRWCKLKGFPVEDMACCAENEPEEKGADNDDAEESTERRSGLGAMIELK